MREEAKDLLVCIKSIAKVSFIEALSEIKTNIDSGRINSLNKGAATKSDFKKGYSQRQICIAYCIMNIHITKENAKKILKEHSATTSIDKLLQKRILNENELTKLTGNKTSDSKHFLDLKKAMRLVSGMKKYEAVIKIKEIIQTFEKKYKLQQ
jgi:hypothetical protein